MDDDGRERRKLFKDLVTGRIRPEPVVRGRGDHRRPIDEDTADFILGAAIRTKWRGVNQDRKAAVTSTDQATAAAQTTPQEQTFDEDGSSHRRRRKSRRARLLARRERLLAIIARLREGDR